MKRLKQGAAALTGVLLLLSGCSGGVDEYLSLIHISEPTRH